MTIQHNTIHHGNCFDLLPSIPDGSVDAIITDPPYGFVKGEFDFVFESWESYLTFIDLLIEPFHRILKPNGSLFIWGHAKNIAYWQVRFDARFELLSHFKWIKANSRVMASDFSMARLFPPVTEHALFYSKETVKTGLQEIFDSPDCFKSIKEYMRGEKRKLKEAKGWNEKDFCNWVQEVTGYSSVIQRHYFADSQYSFPTKENYEKLQTIGFFPREYEALRLEYEALRLEYEALRLGYEALRRPFDVSETRLTDAVTHDQQSHITKKYKHPTQKPIGLMEKIVKSITREGDLILDPFAGSGTTAVACQNLNRNFIAIELHEEYVTIARKRLKESFNLFTDDAFRTE